MEEVLHGIRVLDFSQVKAGPTCGQILGDMGAEVIRIETPEGRYDRYLGPFTPDGRSLYLMFTCRNKKAVTLNLQKEKGKELLEKLVKQSDVLIENFGPDVNKKLELDYESLKKIKPDIIVVAVSAYGQYGPYASRLGFDGVAQAESGLMGVTGFPKDPPLKLGVAVVDTTSGYYGALGTLFALYHRQRTGEGQLVDISLLDTAVSFMESIMAEYKVLNAMRPQIGNYNIYVGPWNAYKAKDGYFFLGVMGNSMFKQFLRVVKREELASDPRFRSDRERAQPENWQFFTDLLNEWAAEKTVDEVVKQFNAVDVPCGRVNTVPQVAADPHIRAREMLVEVEHPGVGKVPLIGIPIKLSKTPGRIKTTAPSLGEHNEEVYCNLLGYTQQEVAQFKDEGVI